MAKIEKKVPNPGVGGTYLFDPKSGKLTLITESPAPTTDGTDSEEVSDRKDRINVRN
jgi:hypothetical protein